MFTGIVEEVGTVQALEERDGGWHLSLSAAVASGGAKLGDSIAVNGACLTVTAIDGERLTFGLAPETLARTNLGGLIPGDPVNLERAMAADGRFDGHMVQGHIDETPRRSMERQSWNGVHAAVETCHERHSFL